MVLNWGAHQTHLCNFLKTKMLRSHLRPTEWKSPLVEPKVVYSFQLFDKHPLFRHGALDSALSEPPQCSPHSTVYCAQLPHFFDSKASHITSQNNLPPCKDKYIKKTDYCQWLLVYFLWKIPKIYNKKKLIYDKEDITSHKRGIQSTK